MRPIAIPIGKKGTTRIFVHILKFSLKHYTLEISSGQSLPNYTGLKKGSNQICLMKPVFAAFLLKVVWSGISLIPVSPMSSLCLFADSWAFCAAGGVGRMGRVDVLLKVLWYRHQLQGTRVQHAPKVSESMYMRRQ